MKKTFSPLLQNSETEENQLLVSVLNKKSTNRLPKPEQSKKVQKEKILRVYNRQSSKNQENDRVSAGNSVGDKHNRNKLKK